MLLAVAHVARPARPAATAGPEAHHDVVPHLDPLDLGAELIEHAAIDLASVAPREIDAVAHLADAVRTRRTTADRIEAALTGRSPVPPLWSFGLWMSRITYKAEAEVRQVAQRLRDLRIPADVLHLDTGWFETDWKSNFEFSNTRFTDPRASDLLATVLIKRRDRIELALAIEGCVTAGENKDTFVLAGVKEMRLDAYADAQKLVRRRSVRVIHQLTRRWSGGGRPADAFSSPSRTVAMVTSGCGTRTLVNTCS